MENLDVLVIRTLNEWRRSGWRAVLATVVRTWGSSPRPIGSIMALREDGAVVGSVSGGCIEDDLIHRYARGHTEVHAGDSGAPVPSRMADRAPLVVKYGVSADEAHRFGLPCGGTLELVLEFNPCAAGLADLADRLRHGELVQRGVRLADGTATLARTDQPEQLRVDGGYVLNTFGPEYRMLLIGAGQLTEYVATMALFNGFAVTVCDPRDEYRKSWSVAGVTLTTEMPDDVVIAFKPDRRSCVIALTHDPKLDDLALIEALKTDAFYIGAIGSRRNDLARRRRMIEHFDQTEASLAALRGPVGLYIGSKLPSEIAVSVMAEVLAVKNGVDVPVAQRVGPAKDLQELPGTTAVCAVATSLADA